MKCITELRPLIFNLELIEFVKTINTMIFGDYSSPVEWLPDPLLFLGLDKQREDRVLFLIDNVLIFLCFFFLLFVLRTVIETLKNIRNNSTEPEKLKKRD